MGRTYERNQGVEAAPLNEEAILLDPATSKFFMLNRTSSFIWDRLATPTTAELLAGAICQSFDNVDMPDALRDVRATLDEMQSMGLVLSKDAG
jgi:coenzyme PQQ synthesis protein D (PqqD)